jgi:hypothetical protein
MAGEKIDYASVININDLDAKIAALQALREAAKAAAALGVLGPQVEGFDALPMAANGDTLGGVPTELPEGAFNGKSVPACIELYLSAVKKKKSNKEIAAALREGGVESNAKDFDTVVGGALFSLKQAGKILRFKDGWGLTAWYPSHIRGSAPGPAKKQSNQKKRRKKPVSPTPVQAVSKNAVAASPQPDKPAGRVEPPVWVPPPAQGGNSAQERIVELLRSKPNTEFSGADVSRELPDIKRHVIALILGRLTDVRRKVAERTPSGNYRIAPNGNTNLHQMSAVS